MGVILHLKSYEFSDSHETREGAKAKTLTKTSHNQKKSALSRGTLLYLLAGDSLWAYGLGGYVAGWGCRGLRVWAFLPGTGLGFLVHLFALFRFLPFLLVMA